MPKRTVQIALTLAVAPLVLGACVHRKMVIRSSPPDAIVVLDGERLAERTPFEREFHWDGSRSLTLMLPDHRVLDTTVDLEERWFDWFPLDLAALLAPVRIEDVQEFDFELVPYAPSAARSPEERAALVAREASVRARAERYRAGGSRGPGRTASTDGAPERPPVAPPREPTEAVPDSPERDQPRFDGEKEGGAKPKPKPRTEEPRFDGDDPPPPPPK